MIFHINKISLLIAFLQICFATLPAESSIWVQEDSSESLHKSALAAMEQKEYDRAEAYLRRLLRRNNLFRETSGRSAWYLLASALENSGEKFDAMDILSRGLDTLRAAGMFDCYLGYHLARLYAENHVDEKNPEITGLINEVLTKINPQKQINLWLEITGLIHRFLSPTELQNLQQEEKENTGRAGQLLQTVFRREDPNPLTQQNEWLPVLFRRTATAKSKYSSRISRCGYDARGEIYVRLGKPWKIFSEHSGVPGEYGYAIQPYEMWFYSLIHPDLYFTFMRERGHGDYKLVDGPESLFSPFYQRRNSILNRNDAGRTANNLRIYLYENIAPIHKTFRSRLYQLQDQISPLQALNYARIHFPEEDQEHAAFVAGLLRKVSFITDSRRESLPLELSLANYMGKDKKSRLDICFGIPNQALLFSSDESGDYTQLLGDLGILDENYVLLHKDSLKYLYRLPAGESVNRGGFWGKWQTELTPAKYYLYFRMENPKGNRIVVFRDTVNVPDFSGDSLQLSDIRLAKDIYPTDKKGDFVTNGLFILPAPAKIFVDEKYLFIYFEIYHLTLNQQGKSRYQVEYSFNPSEEKKGFFKSITFWRRKKKVQKKILKTINRPGEHTMAIEYAKFPRQDFPAGTVKLTIQVRDLLSKKRVFRTIPFKIVKK